MSEIVNESLQKIGKGAVLVLAGTLIGMAINFGSKIMLVRYVSQSEYGLFSLALVIMNVAIIIAMLGLSTGLPRQIGFYRGKEDEPTVRGLVLLSLWIALGFSIFLCLVLYLTSNIVSAKLFHSPELAMPLRILCFTTPFAVLATILASIFRGFERVKPNVYFLNVLSPGMFALLLLLVILLDLQFVGAVYAYVAAIVLTGIAFAIYTVKKPPLVLRGEGSSPSRTVVKELLIFSLPLFGMTMFSNIAAWTDTLMLGYFMMPDDVGLYNAALPLATILAMVGSAISFLYVPLISQFYARDQEEEIKRSYVVITKWMFAAMLPVFLILVLFPEATLNILFGSNYVGAAFTLQILSLGFFIHVMLGPNGVTLVSMGRTQFVMWSTIIAAVANAILNFVLIPRLGIAGAAIATASAFTLKNLFWASKLYSLSKIQPFTKNYLKPVVPSVVLALIIYAIVKNLVSVVTFWLLPMLFVLFLVAYASSLLLTRSFDSEDIMMLRSIEKALGLNLAVVRRILRRFL